MCVCVCEEGVCVYGCVCVCVCVCVHIHVHIHLCAYCVRIRVCYARTAASPIEIGWSLKCRRALPLRRLLGTANTGLPRRVGSIGARLSPNSPALLVPSSPGPLPSSPPPLPLHLPSPSSGSLSPASSAGEVASVRGEVCDTMMRVERREVVAVAAGNNRECEWTMQHENP